MPKKIYTVQLSEKEQEELETYVRQGKKSARAINRACILLLANEGKIDDEIISALGVCRTVVYKMRKKFTESKFDIIGELLQEKPRSGQPLKVDKRVESAVSMIACSEPPPGAARWTLELIGEKLVELKIVDSLCLESVRKALKKTN
ncbi:MAG: Transposase [Candidatus Jettenia ecosi]|uniref:Transposase n=1 Tax=Candidatus Jettenia ecosi TaxID=2494326 RepID=A0A533Q6M2_9BACT|nr:MAG: Transposase [Candidatus Jettenia ecosi]